MNYIFRVSLNRYTCSSYECFIFSYKFCILRFAYLNIELSGILEMLVILIPLWSRLRQNFTRVQQTLIVPNYVPRQAQQSPLLGINFSDHVIHSFIALVSYIRSDRWGLHIKQSCLYTPAKIYIGSSRQSIYNGLYINLTLFFYRLIVDPTIRLQCT